MEDVLEHYGVKGMKWGVRKDARGSSSGGGGSSTAGATKRPAASGTQSPGSAKKKKKKYTEAELRERANKLRLERDYAQLKAEKRNLKNPPATQNARDLYGVNYTKLSDAELRKRLERVRMEKEYTSIFNEQAAKQKNVGRKIAEDILLNTTRELGKTVALNGSKYYLKKALERRGDKGAELAEALFSSGKKKKEDK